MTPAEFRQALAHIGETQAGFARFLVEMGDVSGDKKRTVQRWASDQQDIPGPIVVLLKVLVVARQRAGMTTGSIPRGLDWNTGEGLE